MAKGQMQRFSKENGRAGSAGESVTAGVTEGELERATIVTTVRRLGFIMIKMHEVIMGRLIRQEEHELAEQFNDCFKPLADLLIGFSLDDTLEGENESVSEEGQDNGV